MVTNKAKHRTLFKCDVTGLVGMYVGQKEADSMGLDKNLRKIVYIPLQDLNEGMINRWKGYKQYKKLWKVTRTKYPKNAIIGPDKVRDSNQEEGIFEMQVVAKHDENGRAPHRKNFVDEEMKHRVDQLESELENTKKDSGLKDVDNIEEEDDEDFKRSERGGRIDDLEDEFRRGGENLH